MRYYPVFLSLRGRRCVVVGGGKVAERKVRALLRAQASVRVLSSDLTPHLAQLATKKRIDVIRRPYRKGDLKGQARNGVPLLVFSATNDPAVQQEVGKEAEAIGALVNLADDREHSTFLVPASFARGDLQVAISTSGASPALARNLRRRLQAMLGGEYAAHLRFLREARREVLKSVPGQKERARVFRKLVAGWYEVKRRKSKVERQRSRARSQKADRVLGANPHGS
jgi:precorrin-2 dehydrogenase/sirohydrochlorin ferrochelatase